MPLNLGYVEGTCADGDVVIRVYYDATQPAGPGQPLIDGPRGYCLDVTNRSGRLARLTVDTGTGAAAVDMKVQKGDPVTKGPPSGRSRTAAELAASGLSTRGDVGNFTVYCD